MGKQLDYQEGCQDPICAVLFLVNLVGAIGFACWSCFGEDSLINASSEDSTEDLNGAIMIKAMAVMIVTTVLFSFIAMYCIKACAGTFIKIALVLEVVTFVVLGAICFFYSPIVGIVFLVIAAFSALYMFCIWSRIEFAEWCIEYACKVLEANSGLITAVIGIAFLGFTIFFGWVFVVATAAHRNEAQNLEGDNRYGTFYYIGTFFLYIWPVIALSYSAITMAASVTASYIYQPTFPSATLQAFKRSFTSQFGSICFGSCIQAIVTTLRLAAEIAENAASEDGDDALAIIACLIKCCLDCLGDLLEYFNTYGMIFVGMHGRSYCQACTDVWDLFKSVGLSAIINDDLVGMVLNLFAFFLSACVVGVASLYVHFVAGVDLKKSASDLDNPNQSLIMSLMFGIMIGIALSWVIISSVLQTLSSLVKSIFVIYAEDPAAFEASCGNDTNMQIFTSYIVEIKQASSDNDGSNQAPPQQVIYPNNPNQQYAQPQYVQPHQQQYGQPQQQYGQPQYQQPQNQQQVYY